MLKPVSKRAHPRLDCLFNQSHGFRTRHGAALAQIRDAQKPLRNGGESDGDVVFHFPTGINSPLRMASSMSNFSR